MMLTSFSSVQSARALAEPPVISERGNYRQSVTHWKNWRNRVRVERTGDGQTRRPPVL